MGRDHYGRHPESETVVQASAAAVPPMLGCAAPRKGGGGIWMVFQEEGGGCTTYLNSAEIADGSFKITDNTGNIAGCQSNWVSATPWPLDGT